MQRRFSNRGEACSEIAAVKAKAMRSWGSMSRPKSCRVAVLTSGGQRQARPLARQHPRAPSVAEPMF